MESKKNLAKAIIAVMGECKNIDKNLTVGSGKNQYNGVADKDVKELVQAAMIKHGLCILPIEIEEKTDITRWEEERNGYSNRKTQVFTKVDTKYLLMHESGESQIIVGYGHGVDSQDKSAGKATTYALKYALLYSFMIPTGSIDDTDNNHSSEIKQPVKKVITDEKQWKEVSLEIKEGKIKNIDQVRLVYNLTKNQEQALIKLFK